MSTLDEQLTSLRQKIARIDAKYADASLPAAVRPRRVHIEEWADGRVVENQFGLHYQVERVFAGHKPHGSADVGALSEMSESLLDVLSDNQINGIAPQRWAFLDTETTGLAGGSGTYAFLIGVGRITARGFEVRQFFMREFAEERSQLMALEAHLEEFDVLITYNGKTYDQPLLETRFRMNRCPAPFMRLRHLDLLHGARRLWKLRLENCKLIQLEQQIFGYCREGDLPGHMIPYVYFEYLRDREATRLVPIFHHNALDILTLACLTPIVPAAFRNTDQQSLSQVGVKHGAELAGIARWLMNSGESEQALDVMKRALEIGLPDRLLFRALWDIAALEKKLNGPAAGLHLLKELASCRNDHQACALEQLAKHHEHKDVDLSLALTFAEQALALTRSDELIRRRDRLRRKLTRKTPAQDDLTSVQ